MKRYSELAAWRLRLWIRQHRAEIATFFADKMPAVTAVYQPGTDGAQRPEINEALDLLAEASESGLPVRYARMWLREASLATSSQDEARHLSKAERELGRALLASGIPSNGLRRAFQLTREARSDATD